jgi:hypothetical protein
VIDRKGSYRLLRAAAGGHCWISAAKLQPRRATSGFRALPGGSARILGRSLIQVGRRVRAMSNAPVIAVRSSRWPLIQESIYCNCRSAGSDGRGKL